MSLNTQSHPCSLLWITCQASRIMFLFWGLTLSFIKYILHFKQFYLLSDLTISELKRLNSHCYLRHEEIKTWEVFWLGQHCQLMVRTGILCFCLQIEPCRQICLYPYYNQKRRSEHFGWESLLCFVLDALVREMNRYHQHFFFFYCYYKSVSNIEFCIQEAFQIQLPRSLSVSTERNISFEKMI